MKKQIPLKFILSYSFVFFLVGCTATRGGTENVSIVNAPPVKQGPTVIPPTKPQASDKTLASEKEFKDAFVLIKEIEENFISQNCTEVLDKAKSLEAFSKKINFTSFPPLSQAGIFVCDAKAGIDNPARVQKAISILNGLQMRYPVINEAWLHNTLADFYFALGDKPNALNEKRMARNLILAQQLDVSSLNAQLLQLNPSEPGIQQNSSSNTSDGKNQTLDQIVTSATQMLNNDSPEQAIALLDTIPADQRTDAIKRIRSDAVNTLVMNLRYKVRALFVRSTQQTGSARKETLTQCVQILEGIVRSYPDYADMAAVQNNLNRVRQELKKP